MDVRHRPLRSAALEDALRDAGIWVAATQVAVIYVGTTLVTPLYRLYQQRFGFSQLTLTAIYAAYLLGNLAGLLLLGRLSDQLGRRLVNLAALGCAVLATLLYLFTASTAWLFAGRIVSGLAISLAATSATAWVSEFSSDPQRASVYTTAANFLGLALGSLLAGLLATYLPAPLRLSYLVYLVLLCGSAVLVASARETVRLRVRSARALSLKPRIGVPPSLRAAFLAPAAAAFASFAVIGYYAALIPSVMATALRVTSPALAGAVVALLTVLGAASAVAARSLSSRTAMLAGGALLLPALVLLPWAQGSHSVTLLIAGTVIAGHGTLLGYRGSLQVINEIAPPAGRAGMIASYILVCYSANALPVLGIGLMSTFAGPLAADVTFACVIAALVALSLLVAARRLPRGRARRRAT